MGQKLKNEELNRLSPEEYKLAKKQKLVLVLDNVRSLHNVGSVFRTADAFRLEKIWLCGLTGTPPNKEIEKTALGATSTVEWGYAANTLEAIDALKAEKYRIYAIEQAKGSLSLNEFEPQDEKIALIFGNEIYGVDQEVINHSHGVVEIPQAGSKHSLNIAVSVGIVLWEVLRDKI